MKLLTSSVALDVLGTDHMYKTSVHALVAPVSGVITGDVWLVGGGDPLLATQDYVHTFRRPPEPVTSLEALADNVVAAGVTQITGRVRRRRVALRRAAIRPVVAVSLHQGSRDRADERAFGQRRLHEQQQLSCRREPSGVGRADARSTSSSLVV